MGLGSTKDQAMDLDSTASATGRSPSEVSEDARFTRSQLPPEKRTLQSSSETLEESVCCSCMKLGMDDLSS